MEHFKLFCKANPVKLGIEDPSNGSWDMKKFGEHVDHCKVCKALIAHYQKALIKEFYGRPMTKWEKFRERLPKFLLKGIWK